MNKRGIMSISILSIFLLLLPFVCCLRGGLITEGIAEEPLKDVVYTFGATSAYVEWPTAKGNVTQVYVDNTPVDYSLTGGFLVLAGESLTSFTGGNHTLLICYGDATKASANLFIRVEQEALEEATYYYNKQDETPMTISLSETILQPKDAKEMKEETKEVDELSDADFGIAETKVACVSAVTVDATPIHFSQEEDTVFLENTELSLLTEGAHVLNLTVEGQTLTAKLVVQSIKVPPMLSEEQYYIDLATPVPIEYEIYGMDYEDVLSYTDIYLDGVKWYAQAELAKSIPIEQTKYLQLGTRKVTFYTNTGHTLAVPVYVTDSSVAPVFTKKQYSCDKASNKTYSIKITQGTGTKKITTVMGVTINNKAVSFTNSKLTLKLKPAVFDSLECGTYEVKVFTNMGTLATTLTVTDTADHKGPAVKGVKKNGTYKKKVTITVSDSSGIASATLDGKAFKNSCTASYGTDKKNKKVAKKHTLKATDKMGNQTVITFTVKPK